jgi:hypothetical protein
VPSSSNASAKLSSRPWPGGIDSASRRASSCASKSTSKPRLFCAWMKARSAIRSPAAGSPRADRAVLAMESAFRSSFVAAAEPRCGNKASQAASRPIRLPGLTSTSSHNLRALGRAHGPAARFPSVRQNVPNNLAQTRSAPWTLSSRPVAGTSALSHGHLASSHCLCGGRRRSTSRAGGRTSGPARECKCRMYGSAARATTCRSPVGPPSDRATNGAAAIHSQCGASHVLGKARLASESPAPLTRGYPRPHRQVGFVTHYPKRRQSAMSSDSRVEGCSGYH